MANTEYEEFDEFSNKLIPRRRLKRSEQVLTESDSFEEPESLSNPTVPSDEDFLFKKDDDDLKFAGTFVFDESGIVKLDDPNDPVRAELRELEARLEIQRIEIAERQVKRKHIEDHRREVDENVESYGKIYEDLGQRWQQLTFYNSRKKEQEMVELKNTWDENYHALYYGSPLSRATLLARLAKGLKITDFKSNKTQELYSRSIVGRPKGLHPGSTFIRTIFPNIADIKFGQSIGVFLGAYFELANYDDRTVKMFADSVAKFEANTHILSDSMFTSDTMISVINFWLEQNYDIAELIN